MNVEREITMSDKERKKPERFRDRATSILVATYGCDKKVALEMVKGALAHGSAVCAGNGCIVGIQSNLYRDKLYLGR